MADQTREETSPQVTKMSKLDLIRGLIFGEAQLCADFLQRKPDLSPWMLLKLIDAILRGISQVCFASNPISGLIILVGLGLAGFEMALGALLGPLVAIVTAVALDQPRANIENGLYQFNACLVGTVIPSLYPAVYNGDLGYMTWIMVVVLSALSVPVQSGLANILAAFVAQYPEGKLPLHQAQVAPEHAKEIEMKQRSLVGLTFPFNVVTAIGMALLVSFKDEAVGDGGSVPKESTDIDWIEVLRGVLLSSGQVYAVDTFVGSILMYLALAIYSAPLALWSLFGALLGTFGGLLFTSFPRSMVYDGLWGYSAMLTAAALGHTFFKLNWRTALMVILGCIFTVGIQGLILQTMAKIGVPTFTLPFVFATWTMLILTSERGRLVRK